MSAWFRKEGNIFRTALAAIRRGFSVLKYFIRHEGEVVTRDALLNEVWGYESFPTTRTVDNYVLSLRKKLEADPGASKHFLLRQ